MKKVDQQESSISFSSIESIIRTVSKKGSVSKKDKLEKDLGLDSLKRIQLAALIEENIGIEVNELNLTPSTTVNDLVKLVKKGGNTKGGGKYSVDKILEHWRFNPLVKRLRHAIQKGIIFPLHASWAKLDVIKGKDILNNLPKQSFMIFNHVGMFDAISVMRLLPSYTLKKTMLPATHEAWSEGIASTFKLMDLTMNAFPFVKKGEGFFTGFEVIGELACQGYSFIFSPEGRLQKEHKLQEFKGGLGLLVKELKIPVVMFKIGKEYRNIWAPPPPGTKAVNAKGQFLPIGKGVVPVKIGYANVNYTLNQQQITKSIRKQFVEL